MKVLIIEDTKTLAQTLADLVGEAGHFADLVFDGDTGLEYARSGLYDAIVLDAVSYTHLDVYKRQVQPSFIVYPDT